LGWFGLHCRGSAIGLLVKLLPLPTDVYVEWVAVPSSRSIVREAISAFSSERPFSRYPTNKSS